jgi:hypothetical protein
LKLFPHITLMVQSKILQLKNKNKFIQFALEVAVLECSFLKFSQRILGVNVMCHPIHGKYE